MKISPDELSRMMWMAKAEAWAGAVKSLRTISSEAVGKDLAEALAQIADSFEAAYGPLSSPTPTKDDAS